MTKINIIWLGILSIIATMLIGIFHGTIFNVCFSPSPELVSLHSFANAPLADCLLYTSSVTFAGLFLGPIAITLVIVAGYVLIFNRGMPSSPYYLWFFWIVCLYFFYYQFNFLPQL